MSVTARSVNVGIGQVGDCIYVSLRKCSNIVDKGVKCRDLSGHVGISYRNRKCRIGRVGPVRIGKGPAAVLTVKVVLVGSPLSDPYRYFPI